MLLILYKSTSCKTNVNILSQQKYRNALLHTWNNFLILSWTIFQWQNTEKHVYCICKHYDKSSTLMPNRLIDRYHAVTQHSSSVKTNLNTWNATRSRSNFEFRSLGQLRVQNVKISWFEFTPRYQSSILWIIISMFPGHWAFTIYSSFMRSLKATEASKKTCKTLQVVSLSSLCLLLARHWVRALTTTVMIRFGSFMYAYRAWHIKKFLLAQLSIFYFWIQNIYDLEENFTQIQLPNWQLALSSWQRTRSSPDIYMGSALGGQGSF